MNLSQRGSKRPCLCGQNFYMRSEMSTQPPPIDRFFLLAAATACRRCSLRRLLAAASPSPAMNVLLLLGIYFSVLLVVVVALLFGENPAFASTPLPRLHWLLTTGLGNAFDRLGCASCLLCTCRSCPPLLRLETASHCPPPCTRSSAVQRLPGGRRLAACAQGTAALCFERRNPAVQLLFLCLLCGCYWLFCSSVFPMLPLPGLPAWHK